MLSFNIKAYFEDLDFLELAVFFASFFYIYSPIFKGSFLQLRSMSLSFHIGFILTILPRFIFFFCFFFFLWLYYFSFFFFFFFFFLLFFYLCELRSFCRTRAVSGKLFYFFFALLFFI